MEDLLEQMRIDICNIINSSNLILSAKFYVVKDIYREIESTYQRYLSQLAQEQYLTNEEVEKEEHVEIPIPVDQMSDEMREKWEALQEVAQKEQQAREEQNSSSSND